MINRDDIEAGDKVYTRDGGCMVAYMHGEYITLAGHSLNAWDGSGLYLACCDKHPLDIIRIEKAPKPVVVTAYMCSNGGGWCADSSPNGWAKAIKLTIINGKLDKAEQVK